MNRITRSLNQQQLKAVCDIVAHTSQGLTKSELTTLLGQSGICLVDDGSSRNQLGYTIGLNKRDNPHGLYLENKPKIEKSYPEMDKFIEMCFESGTPMNERLKDTLKQMMREDVSEYK